MTKNKRKLCFACREHDLCYHNGKTYMCCQLADWSNDDKEKNIIAKYWGEMPEEVQLAQYAEYDCWTNNKKFKVPPKCPYILEHTLK